MGKFRYERRQRQSRGRIARDHHMLGMHRVEKFKNPPNAPRDGSGGLVAVRKIGSIPKIEQILARQGVSQGLGDGQTAQTTINDSDRRGCVYHIQTISDMADRASKVAAISTTFSRVACRRA